MKGVCENITVNITLYGERLNVALRPGTNQENLYSVLPSDMAREERAGAVRTICFPQSREWIFQHPEV